VQWELATACPAGSSVEAATTPSRHHVVCHFGTVRAPLKQLKIEK